MRSENKPLLQDHPGFLQEITAIAVGVGLTPNTRRTRLRFSIAPHCFLLAGEITVPLCFWSGAPPAATFTSSQSDLSKPSTNNPKTVFLRAANQPTRQKN